MKRIQLFVLLFINVFVSVAAPAEPTVLRMSSVSEPTAFEFVTQLYKLINQKQSEFRFDLAAMPGARGPFEANHGRIDGMSMRYFDFISSIDKPLPNLIRVPEPLFRMDLWVVTAKKQKEIKDLKAFAKTKVGYQRGYSVPQHGLNPEVRNPVNGMAEGLVMLKKGEVSHYIDIGLSLRPLRARDKELKKNFKIYPLGQPRAVHMFVHKKHETEIARLSKAIRQVKSKTSLQSLFENFLREIENRG